MTADSMSSILDGPGAEPRFLCGSCSWQYNRLMLGRMNPAVQEMEELSKTEQMDHLRRIVADLDAGMQAWVRQRDN